MDPTSVETLLENHQQTPLPFAINSGIESISPPSHAHPLPLPPFEFSPLELPTDVPIEEDFDLPLKWLSTEYEDVHGATTSTSSASSQYGWGSPVATTPGSESAELVFAALSSITKEDVEADLRVSNEGTSWMGGGSWDWSCDVIGAECTGGAQIIDLTEHA
ncbi:hypothetical protein P7C70_g5468, partial [Phenoliferia sp. Uapishka_3]